MSITKHELQERVNKLKEYKAMQEEIKDLISAIESEVKDYMTENNLEKEVVDNATITFKEQIRSSLDKDKLVEVLGDLEEYTTTSVYNVLRIK